MNDILESLELSEETKTDLLESFEKRVEVEAEKLLEKFKSEQSEDFEEKVQEKVQEIKEELEETLDSYMEKVVEQFVEDNTFAIEESIKSEKYEAVLEGFNSLMIATGVEIAQIAESKDKLDEETNENAEALADKLMAENIKLKEKNSELLRVGLIKEAAEDMTSIKKDKFFKLAKVVEFKDSDPVDFIEKINTIAESISSEKIEKKEEVVTESVTSKKYVSNASHLF